MRRWGEIGIVKRGGAGSLLMCSYLEERKRDYIRLFHSSSAAYAAFHVPGGRSAHPEVLRYA